MKTISVQEIRKRINRGEVFTDETGKKIGFHDVAGMKTLENYIKKYSKHFSDAEIGSLKKAVKANLDKGYSEKDAIISAAGRMMADYRDEMKQMENQVPDYQANIEKTLKEKTVKTEVVVEGTKEKVTIEQDADKAYKDAERRLGIYKRILAEIQK